jgi:glycosyltransferase involved in cell wall biosynthesis
MQSYALITAVRDEAAHIERTIQAVLAQTVTPSRWAIASDGSSDGTDEIVASYSQRHPFIVLVRVEGDADRNFGSKMRALHAAEAALADGTYDCIANLDGDITFDRTYFSTLLDRFHRHPRLGIAGGWIHEDDGRGFVPRRRNLQTMVPHAVQCVRRTCYEDIGGYAPLRYGGEDTCAAVEALMRGWHVRAFDDLPVRHYRRTASAGSVFRNRFRQGRADYALGYAPWFEVLKCARRLLDPPMGIGSVLWLSGFAWSCLKAEPRPVSPRFVAFLRSQQRARLAGPRQPVSSASGGPARPASWP